MCGETIYNYLQMTGQSFQELMGGAHSYGFPFIEALAAQCVGEKKRIVWKDEWEIGYDAISYTLEDI